MDRSKVVSWVVPALVVLVVGLLTINAAPVGVLHDDAMYVILAKSLATGHGYRYLNLPGHPAATHFPPGYPAFLALLWTAVPSFPRNVAIFKLANVALLVVTFWLLARYIRRQLAVADAPSRALAVVVTIGLPTLLLCGLVLSEPLFLLLIVWGLSVAEDVASRDVPPAQWIGQGLLCGVVVLVRSAGIALLVATVAQLMLRRRFRAAITTGVAAVVVLAPWQIWVGAHGHDVPDALQGAYGPYADWVVQAIHRDGLALVTTTLALNARQSLDFIVSTICPLNNAAARVAAMCVLVVTVAIGARRVWRLAPVTLLFLVCYVGLVLVWPVPPARYIWGVWPVLLIVPGLAIAETLEWRPSRRSLQGLRVGLLGCSFAATVGYVVYNVEGYRQQQWRNIPVGGGMMLRPVVLSVRGHVANDEAVAVTAEAAVYLYTGRSTVPIYSLAVDPLFKPPTVQEQAKAMRAILSAYPVKVVLASTALQQAAMRSLQREHDTDFALRDSAATEMVFVRDDR